MGLSIHTNFASLTTQNQLNSTNKMLGTAMQRLGTGLRINSAADDAAGKQAGHLVQANLRDQGAVILGVFQHEFGTPEGVIHPGPTKFVQVHAQGEVLNTDSLEHDNYPDRRLPETRRTNSNHVSLFVRQRHRQLPPPLKKMPAAPRANAPAAQSAAQKAMQKLGLRRDIDLALAGMVLEKNGEVISTSTGAAVQGSPVNAVAWLANTLGAFGIPFKAGELILSGSLAPLVPAQAGDRFHMTIEGLGECSVAFTE